MDFCKRSLASGVDLLGLKIVVDAANGACHEVAPIVFHELGAHVIVMGAAPNGLNINDQVGATVPQYLSQAVRAHRADVGIALDGDGDRLAMVDAEGRIFEGDELLYVLACDTQRHGVLMTASSRRCRCSARCAVRERGWLNSAMA